MMTITPQTPDVALPIAAFIRRHYKLARHWPREVLLGWVRWHLGEGFLGYVVDGEDDGARRIVGVGVARPVMKPEDGHEDYQHDQEGPVLFVDMACVTTGPLTMSVLITQMRRRFGMRERVAFLRRGRLVAHPMKRWYYRLMRPLFLAYPLTAS